MQLARVNPGIIGLLTPHQIEKDNRIRSYGANHLLIRGIAIDTQTNTTPVDEMRFVKELWASSLGVWGASW